MLSVIITVFQRLFNNFPNGSALGRMMFQQHLPVSKTQSPLLLKNIESLQSITFQKRLTAFSQSLNESLALS